MDEDPTCRNTMLIELIDKCETYIHVLTSNLSFQKLDKDIR